MPKTFMRSFYVGAKLRWMSSAESWPADEDFREMLGALKDVFKEAAEHSNDRILSGFSSSLDRDDDTVPLGRSAGQDQELEETLYDFLLAFINSRIDPGNPYYASSYDLLDGSDKPFLPSVATFFPYVTRAGATFATREHSLRNSFVLFRRASGDGEVLAGQVNRIFEHTRIEGDRTIVQTYLIIREYRRLLPAHEAHDPFRQYPDINTWLCYNQTHTTENIVRLEDVVSHFASYVYKPEGIGHDCIVVRSLDRVSPFCRVHCTTGDTKLLFQS